MKPIALFFFSFLFLHCAAQKKLTEPVRGTWVTNVASDALSSKEKIAETVRRCKSLGLNTLYVVTWNKGLSLYPSPVVEKYIGIKQDPVYNGFDPIREIITQAHKEGLRVIGWFEYGFAYHYGDTNSVWLKKYPHWAGRDSKGNLLQKNKFFWWNSLHPEVQAFMTEMILDFVKRYDADGIQGDDRLPAMPGEGGYDAFTRNLYANEHGGAQPPPDPKDSAWLQWRASKLNSYIKDLYRQIKNSKAGYTVSWAPSIYPWSKEQYLQDWPTWLKEGYADEVLPQLYRYNIAGYEKILKELDSQLTPAQKHKVFPGMLISLGDGYQVSNDLMQQMLQLNRKYGFSGECTFYYEGLKNLKPFYQAATIDSSYANSYYQQRLAFFGQMRSYKKEIVFLGNSITEAGEWQELVPGKKVKNRGISGDLTYGVLARLDQLLASKPSKIFLLIGVNDLKRGIPLEVIINNYQRIVERTRTRSPKTELFLQSVLPVNEAMLGTPYSRITNLSIDSLNLAIEKLAKAHNCRYLNLHLIMKDDKGQLAKELTTDGIHLKPTTYIRWVDFLRKQKCL